MGNSFVMLQDKVGASGISWKTVNSPNLSIPSSFE